MNITFIDDLRSESIDCCELNLKKYIFRDPTFLRDELKKNKPIVCYSICLLVLVTKTKNFKPKTIVYLAIFIVRKMFVVVVVVE